MSEVLLTVIGRFLIHSSFFVPLDLKPLCCESAREGLELCDNCLLMLRRWKFLTAATIQTLGQMIWFFWFLSLEFKRSLKKRALLKNAKEKQMRIEEFHNRSKQQLQNQRGRRKKKKKKINGVTTPKKFPALKTKPFIEKESVILVPEKFILTPSELEIGSSHHKSEKENEGGNSDDDEGEDEISSTVGSLRMHPMTLPNSATDSSMWSLNRGSPMVRRRMSVSYSATLRTQPPPVLANQSPLFRNAPYHGASPPPSVILEEPLYSVDTDRNQKKENPLHLPANDDSSTLALKWFLVAALLFFGNVFSFVSLKRTKVEDTVDIQRFGILALSCFKMRTKLPIFQICFILLLMLSQLLSGLSSSTDFALISDCTSSSPSNYLFPFLNLGFSTAGLLALEKAVENATPQLAVSFICGSIGLLLWFLNMLWIVAPSEVSVLFPKFVLLTLTNDNSRMGVAFFVLLNALGGIALSYGEIKILAETQNCVWSYGAQMAAIAAAAPLEFAMKRSPRSNGLTMITVIGRLLVILTALILFSKYNSLRVQHLKSEDQTTVVRLAITEGPSSSS